MPHIKDPKPPQQRESGETFYAYFLIETSVDHQV